MQDLSGQTVIITGAGAGIGRALAVGFVDRGAHVVAIGRSAPGLEQTRQLCAGRGTSEAHVADVTEAATLERLFGTVVGERGGIDLLINNAAVYPRAMLHEMSIESWTQGVATNLNGVAHACRAAVRVFPVGRAAVILNVGSFAHLGPEPASTLYCATKAAVGAFTRALAVELSAAGSALIVNEWIPGRYQTRMSGHTGDDPALAFERLLATWQASKQGPGGRTFQGASEVLPPRSLRSRVKSWFIRSRD
ncbi:MAG TPA: SDR family oxidoreductase [Steroidobacteraceae bacterium]|jgi:NAD(P)-dependent dehydrogenase (short-subunit alcohol dehydrogenase family)|nr:SDR family oxidoreductase [Steroidobacteraceae bacterium]